jgi:uncharacterized protein
MDATSRYILYHRSGPGPLSLFQNGTARPSCATSKNVGCERSSDSIETGSLKAVTLCSTCAPSANAASVAHARINRFLPSQRWKLTCVGFSPLKFLALGLIRFYKLALSPLLPRSCRYYPTCSSYAEQAFKKYGFFKALGKSLWRLLRCNPFSPGGVDHP